MLGRHLLAVAAVVALAAPAAAAAQSSDPPTELWRQFPLDPTPTPAVSARTAAAGVPEAAASGDGASSATAWLIAGALGIAGIGLTIAGLASARREPQDEARPATRRRRREATARDRQADAEARARRRAATEPPTATTETGTRPRPRAGKDGAAATPEGSGRGRGAAAEGGGSRTGGRPPTERARPRPTGPPDPVPAPPGITDDVDWEECHIVLAIDEGDDHHFYAEHAGAADPVARSPVFHARRTATVMESAPARDALQALVTKLLASGWQVVGRDDDAWALKFRRRVPAGDRERHPAGR